MAESKDLLTQTLGLPWSLQVALASGYAAYLISFTGIRKNHKTIDTAFSTLVFSLSATAALWVSHSWNHPLQEATLAFFSAIILGLVWRKFGRKALISLLRAVDVTWSNDDESALETISADSENRISQIAVLLDNDTWLRCDDTTKFHGAPFAPYVLGPTGDVALYLTHTEALGEESKELKTVRSDYFGDRITYVPAARIRRMTLRFAPRPSRPSTAGVAAWLHWWRARPSAARKPVETSDSPTSVNPLDHYAED